jgi:prepilin-type processing-associated H-X9-DG protein
MSPYLEETALHGAINFCDPNDAACVEPGFQKVSGILVAQYVVAALQCPSDDKRGLINNFDHVNYWTAAGLNLPATFKQAATTNYAGSLGSQKMESWNGFKLNTVVGNGGAKYDADDDGEDWFNQNTNAGYPCPTGGASGTNIRADCPDAKTVSGVFARGTWAAAIKDITDGTSHTIAMGEIRPRCSAFQWIHGWSLAEGLWFATTAPINYPTDPDQFGTSPPLGGDWERDFNTAMGFKSQHPGGANFGMADGSSRYLSQDIDYTTYQMLGARADGETLPDTSF